MTPASSSSPIPGGSQESPGSSSNDSSDQSSDDEVFPIMRRLFLRESYRRLTFIEFKDCLPDGLSSQALAQAGFLHLSHKALICVFCDYKVRVPLEAHPFVLHKDAQGRSCPFLVRNNTCGNVPMEPISLKDVTPASGPVAQRLTRMAKFAVEHGVFFFFFLNFSFNRHA